MPLSDRRRRDCIGSNRTQSEVIGVVYLTAVVALIVGTFVTGG